MAVASLYRLDRNDAFLGVFLLYDMALLDAAFLDYKLSKFFSMPTTR